MEADASREMNSSASLSPSNDDLPIETVSVKDNYEGNVSEDEGFVSGNEDFDAPPEKRLVGETGEGGVDVGESEVISEDKDSNEIEVYGFESDDGEIEPSDFGFGSKEEVLVSDVGDSGVVGEKKEVLDGDSGDNEEVESREFDVFANDEKTEALDSVPNSKEVVVEGDSGDGAVEEDEGKHLSDKTEVEPEASKVSEDGDSVVENNTVDSEVSRAVPVKENGGEGIEREGYVLQSAGDTPLKGETEENRSDGEAAALESAHIHVNGKVDLEQPEEEVDGGLPNGDHEDAEIGDSEDKRADIETEKAAENPKVTAESLEDPAFHVQSQEITDFQDQVDVEADADESYFEEIETGSAVDSQTAVDNSLKDFEVVDGQIVTDSEEDADSDNEGNGKELFDSSALAALLKAATGADSDGDTITITSQDGSRLFSIERPAGLGSSLRSLRPASRLNRPGLFSTSTPSGAESEVNLSEEEKKKLVKLQQIRVKFLRLVHRLGLSPEEPMAAQVLYRLALLGRSQNSQFFSFDDAKKLALELEANKDDLEFSVNILVLGKNGVGKSATINSLFGEEKVPISTFEVGTSCPTEVSGFIDGVKVRVVDTPGLKTSIMDQGFNQRVLSSVKNITKRTPSDVVLYVDRLNSQNRDLDDLPLMKTVTKALGSGIWRNGIVTLTHAASAPPDGPAGAPLSYDVFVSQRSHVVQQAIGRAVGDLRMMSPSLMNPVSLVENHKACRTNREGHKILPNGKSWRPQLLLLCYSMKILSEANSLARPQEPFDHRKLFGFRVRTPPLPYMLSSMLQSRPHPKLQSDQGGENADSDIDLDDLLDSDQEEDDEYDQLPSFKPLSNDQLEMLSKEQRKAYFEEYDYRVKLLHKKQWKEELRRIKEMRKRGKDASTDSGFPDDDDPNAPAAPVAVPLPDMALPPTFDGDNPSYRYRFLEPTSQFHARPVLDTHGWDHDCGYDGVNFEHNLAIVNRFPVNYTIQVTKDKKDFTISLDSAVAAKLGDVSAMANFDIQSMGKQLAYILRAESKFKKVKHHKPGGGISITFLGENVIPGLRIEDHISFGKQYAMVGSAGVVKSQSETAYGANIELQRRELDYPIGQVQSTLSMSIIKWRGDLALGFNSLAQFAIGRNSKIAVRAGINNKLSGQITVRTSSSEQISLALAAIIPAALSIYKKLWAPAAAEKFSIY